MHTFRIQAFYSSSFRKFNMLNIFVDLIIF